MTRVAADILPVEIWIDICVLAGVPTLSESTCCKRWTLDQFCDLFVRRADGDVSAALALVARARPPLPDSTKCARICNRILTRGWSTVPVRGYVDAIIESNDIVITGMLFVMMRRRILLEYRFHKGLPAFDWDFEAMLNCLMSTVNEDTRRSFDGDRVAWKKERFGRIFRMFWKLSVDLDIKTFDIVSGCLTPVAMKTEDDQMIDEVIVMIAASRVADSTGVIAVAKDLLLARYTLPTTTVQSTLELVRRLLLAGGQEDTTIFSIIFDMALSDIRFLWSIACMIAWTGDFPAHFRLLRSKIWGSAP